MVRALDRLLSEHTEHDPQNRVIYLRRAEERWPRTFGPIFRASGREDDEDVVLEVMDFLTDRSSPHMRL